jgi:hypothetical protein
VVLFFSCNNTNFLLWCLRRGLQWVHHRVLSFLLFRGWTIFATIAVSFAACVFLWKQKWDFVIFWCEQIFSNKILFLLDWYVYRNISERGGSMIWSDDQKQSKSPDQTAGDLGIWSLIPRGGGCPGIFLCEIKGIKYGVHKRKVPCAHEHKCSLDFWIFENFQNLALLCFQKLWH